MQNKVLFLFLGLIFMFAACGEDEGTKGFSIKKGERNPNGDSELALLMRDMETDCIRLKKQLDSSESPTLSVDIERIKTAQATEPEKSASDTYQHFADAYIELARNLERAPAETLESHYKGMVSACMGCHQAHCPGPMVRIKKLF